ncbi:5320_t:CDS:1 [Ambispora leptoticha]|uniref:5320_t:CDS:1 n=1 Tax=Ambispora leptoticha TaxID=144679 RepID=A0A9N8ZEH7_9GLOM|nr:5320_t:CDS:1 [Ambispora leptoticha]
MSQPYRIQDSRIGMRIQPQSIQDNNTRVARNRFSRRGGGDRISRKNSGRSDVISFSVEEAGETSINSNESIPTVIESSDNESTPTVIESSDNESTPTVIESSDNESTPTVIESSDSESTPMVIELSDSEQEQIQPENPNNPSSQNVTHNAIQRVYIDLVDDNEENEENEEQIEIIYISDEEVEVIELSDSEEQVQPENSNNSPSQNVTQNAIQRIYIDLVDDDEEDEENEGQTEIIYISDEEEPDYDNEEELDIEPSIVANQAEIRRRIQLYGQIRPQTEEERSPSPREGFTTDLDKDTIVICSRCNHGMENGMCALYCGHVVCVDCGTLYEEDMISFCRVCKEYTAKDEVTRLFF